MINHSLIKVYKLIVGNRRIDRLSSVLMQYLPDDINTLLDFGCGTGKISSNIAISRPKMKIIGLDTLVRPETYISVQEFNGKGKLPFESSTFDAVMAIDVIHHTHNPREVFEKLVEVSNGYIIIKDHIANTFLDRITLKFMDFIGNKPYGVSLPYNYLSQIQWEDLFKNNDLKVKKVIYKLNLYPKPFDFIFGRNLHFLIILKK